MRPILRGWNVRMQLVMEMVLNKTLETVIWKHCTQL